MPADKKNEQIADVLSSISDDGEQIDALAKIRGWFRPKANSGFYLHIQSYLQGKAGLDATLNSITEPIDAALTKNRPSDIDTYDLWYSIFHSAKRIPYRDGEDHGRLVELVRAFKNHPGPSHSDATAVYGQLRDFGIAARETVNDVPGVGAGYSKPEIHAWANLNSFFARLTQTKDHALEFWTYCIVAMREGLEEDHQSDPPGLMDAGTRVEKYNAHVPAAAVWVFVLGKAMHEKQQDLTPKPRQGNPARGGKFWNGKPEFSKERWALWKKRFEDISDMAELSDETRAIAKEASKAMEEIEGA